MRWDDPVFTGERGEWSWFVFRSPIEDLLDLTLSSHLGSRLWICTFDSSPITPGDTELAAGWSVVDGMMVSPPVSERLEVPSDQFDEWYVFPDGLDWLYPIQERFWSQIETLRPISYIASGDNEVLVTRSSEFRAVLTQACGDKK